MLPFIHEIDDEPVMLDAGRVIYDLLKGELKKLPIGGKVIVTGEEIESPFEIGAGIADLLANIPRGRVAIEEIGTIRTNVPLLSAEEKLRWIQEKLIPRGLMEEIQDGYQLTRTALNATYHIKMSNPLQHIALE